MIFELVAKVPSVDLFTASSLVASAAVALVTSAAKSVVNVFSAVVALVASAVKLVVNVFSAVVALVASAFKLVVNVFSAAVALVASAVKLVVKVPSAVVALITSAAKAVAFAAELALTYVFTAFSVGNLVSELAAKVPSVLLFAVFSFEFSAVCVAILMGLFISLVLSTFSSPRLVFAPITVVAFVPPLAIGTIPVTCAAFVAEKAKGTLEKFWLLISRKLPHCPFTSNATFNPFCTALFQSMVAKEEA